LSIHTTEEVAKQHVQLVFDRLMEFLPIPSDEEIKEESLQKLDFSSVECFMFMLHKLGAKHPSFLSDVEFAEKLKEFRSRLTYFGRLVQAYIKQLKASLQGASGAQLEEGDNKLKVTVLKTCNNIYALIKDFLHNPPSYKSTVQVSWKSKSSPLASSNESVDQKRKRAGITPISLENLPAKKDRPSNTPKGKLYSIPSERKGIAMDEKYEGSGRGGRQWQQGKSPNRNRGGNRGNRGGRGGFNRNRQEQRYGNRQEEHENFLRR